MLELLKKLMAEDVLNPFYLVGGTALALQLGHRKSIDIDLFCHHPIEYEQIEEILVQKYGIQNVTSSKGGINGFIGNIKIDIMPHRYPLLNPVIVVENIRLLSLPDIGAMKINAITNRGAKKDFWDLAELLNYYSAEELFEFFKNKYSNYNCWHVIKSLTWFEDADSELIEIDSLKSISWNDVKQKIIDKAKMIKL